MSSIMNIMRLVAMGAVCACSIIVLGIDAHLIFITELDGFYYIFIAFSLAIAGLTLLTFPPLLLISLLRKGALPNYVAVELAVTGLFWVLWLAAAAYDAQNLILVPATCDIFTDTGFVVTCQEIQAMHAFSWLNWLFLTAYFPFLLTMAIVQQNRGNPVWTKSVNDVNMFAPRVVVIPGSTYPPQQQPAMYVPQQPQVVYPPGTPGTNYIPSPAPQPGYISTPPPQPGYVPSPPPQQPQQYPVGGSAYPQV